MSTTADRHYTPEECEQAAMDRLGGEERRAFEDHIRSCPACRAIYREERLIVEGTRQWARNALKARLGRPAASQDARRVPWPHVLAAAAVVVVVVGVGILGHWYQRPEPMLTTAEESIIARQEPPSGTGNTPPPVPSPVEAQAESPVDPAVTLQKKSVAAGELEDRSPAGSSVGTGAAEYQRTRAATLSSPVPASGPALAEKADADIPGILVFGSPVGAATAPGEAERKKKGETVNTMERELASPDRSAGLSMAAPATVFIVGQRSAVRVDATGGSVPMGRVPARFVRSGDSLLVTLLLDTLLREEELRAVVVRRVSPDSLVVLLPSRTIGYRLPPGLLP